MRLLHAEFLDHCWKALAGADRGWHCKETFYEWAETQDEVDGRAVQTYLTKINSEESWDGDNAAIINITTDADWNMIQSGAIAFGGGDQ